MTSSNDPGGPPEQRGRRRPPIIELTATEVKGAAATAPESSVLEAGPARSEPAAAAAEPTPSPTQPTEAVAEAPTPEPPAAGSTKADPDAERPSSKSRAAWTPSGFPWPLAAAGAAGMALTVIVLAMTGMFSGGDTSAPPLDPRLARMEQQLRELAARPTSAGVDQTSVDDLASRLARLETIAATPRPAVADPAVANHIATLEGEIKALAEKVGVLGRRSDEIASIASAARKSSEAVAAAIADLQKVVKASAPTVQRADIDALNKRIAALEQMAKALEQMAKSLQAEIAQRAGGDDRSLRLLVLANTLRSAVERGAPYAVEFDAAKAAAANPAVLSPLEPFAKTGVPSTELLLRELSALMPALTKATGSAPQAESFIDRLKANAERIVRVNPIDEVAGDDPKAVIQRIEARVAQGNLAGALVELQKLPEPARALAKDVVARAEARTASIEASGRFSADALAVLGKPSL